MGGTPPATAGADARLHWLARHLRHAGAYIATRYAALAAHAPAGGAERRFRSSFAALVDDVDDRLETLFRDYVGATVTAVSPLVVSACRIEGLDLDACMGTVRHDGPWRPWLGGPPRKGSDPWRQPPGHAFDRLRASSALRGFQRCGVVVREEGDEAGALGFRIGANCVEIAMRTDLMELATGDGRATLALREPLPETIRLGIRGRLLDEVVDHPLFRSRGYRISRVVIPPGRGSRVEFRAEPIRWTLPWARVRLDGPVQDDEARAGG